MGFYKSVLIYLSELMNVATMKKRLMLHFFFLVICYLNPSHRYSKNFKGGRERVYLSGIWSARFVIVSR